jgi:hypothetical protein
VLPFKARPRLITDTADQRLVAAANAEVVTIGVDTLPAVRVMSAVRLAWRLGVGSYKHFPPPFVSIAVSSARIHHSAYAMHCFLLANDWIPEVAIWLPSGPSRIEAITVLSGQ